MSNCRNMEVHLGNNCKVELISEDVPLKDRVQEKVDIADQQEMDCPVFIADLGDIINKQKLWKQHLPCIKPFYAVKCNDEYPVLKVLAELGVNFDCASKIEIEKVLALGISPDRIIYAHTCKHPSMLKYAEKRQVTMTTFDNEDELYKIKQIHPKVKCILRIRPSSNYKVTLELGTKFGCDQDEVKPLLKTAKSLDLVVIGVSFHVGYLCQDPEAYIDAIKKAKGAFDIGRELGFDMTLLDIGGGFPGKKNEISQRFEGMSEAIKKSIAKYFHGNTDITVIAEPGEFFVSSAFTLASKIIARKYKRVLLNRTDDDVKDGINQVYKTSYIYHLNDGIYGSFRAIIGYSIPGVYPHQLKGKEEVQYDSVLFGPACDNNDVLYKAVLLQKHQIGEWIYFPNMGAYTIPTRSAFNGMPEPHIYYTCSNDAWNNLTS